MNKDLRDDIKMTLDYIDELEDTINKAIKEINKNKYFIDIGKVLDILKRIKDKPEYLGYSDKECINCGRLRVEKYSNGTEICEKCNFEQNKKEYILRD